MSFNMLCICLHLFSDTMLFNLTGHNSTLIRCEINVTADAGFVLSICHDAYKPQTAESDRGDYVPDLPYITLSKTIFLRGDGKYECQLHLNEVLLTKSIFYYQLPGNNLLSDLI